MGDFRKLLVWRKAHELGIRTYRVATGIRRAQDLGLKSQIVRAAMSIPTNIVEGRHQQSEKEFVHFLRIAFNSAIELEYHLMVAREIGALSDSDSDAFLRDLIEVRRMLHGLIQSVSKRFRPARPA
jgi:four helix bundle protein